MPSDKPQAARPPQEPTMTLELTINGSAKTLQVNPGEVALDTLRRAGYASVKRGCDEGDCGSCSILVDGRLMRACLLYAGQLHGRTVTTVEDLGTARDPHPIQRSFVDAGAVQCGYCTPGMVLATHALLTENPDPSEDQIREGLDGNLCRCTGYVKILDGVRLAAQSLRDGGDQ
jgi:aerobic-type carbon monoxide dehydrogenase small subunit (CoxS/CutS family)